MNAENRIAVGSSTLYIRLADEILSYIRKNEIKKGQRIPSERKLAELFHTSRTSVREAVRILQNKNILEIQVGNGMYLKSGASDESYRIEVWKSDYKELLDVKTTLEFHIIEELCEYISPADYQLIEEALVELEDGYQNRVFNKKADFIFHQRIRNCSTNLTLIQMLDSLIQKLDEYGTQVKEIDRVWYQTIPFHRDLLEAIYQHDVASAKRAFFAIAEIDIEALQG